MRQPIINKKALVPKILPTITIVGAGGIGCSLAATIQHSGHPVKLVEKCKQKIRWAKQNGIQVTGIPTQTIPIQSFDSWNPSDFELLILCTKSYNNKSIIDKNLNWQQVITIQNGFEYSIQNITRHGEAIASYIAECIPGKTQVRITRGGALHLGTYLNHGEHLPLFAELARLIHIPSVRTVVTSNITKFKYTKFLYNCAISPLASGCGVDNGQLLGNPSIKPLFLGLLRENLGIMASAGIELGKVGPFEPKTVVAILRNRWIINLMASWFQRSLNKTYCSMACDWSTGVTELEDYLGHLIRLAGNHPCPLNRALYDWCRERLSRNLPPSLELADLLGKVMSRAPK